MATTVGVGGCGERHEAAGPPADDGRVDEADEALAPQLAERAQAEGINLAGPGGLLGRLTKVVLESALEGEMDAHLGYAKHDPAGNGSGNSRNGKRVKTVLADVGPVQSRCPATGAARSSRRSWRSGSGGWAGWMTWSSRWSPRA